MSSVFLGIDLGTSNVKACLINDQKEIIRQLEKASNANIVNPEHPKWHEQDGKKILGIALELLHDFEDLFATHRLECIGISGQMHDVVLWQRSSLSNSLEHLVCSNLVTWMDQRCDAAFLEGLPRWIDENGEHNVSSGYGCATLAWLSAHNALNKRWDCAGTIMDLLVAYLTDSPQVVMSTHLACSWGYCSGNQWIVQENNGHIPVHLLPTIVDPGYVVGKTTSKYPYVVENVKVLVAMGDSQASVLPILKEGEAVIHIGTSSQILFPTTKHDFPTTNNHPALMRWPFFFNQKLIVAASLNGGNAFEIFVEQVTSWTRTLFADTPGHMKLKQGFLEQVFSDPSTQSSTLSLKPVFLGERHQPQGGASLQGWTANTSVDQMLVAIARGIVSNLAEMMPEKVLAQCNIPTIRLINKATQPVFVEVAGRSYPNSRVVTGQHCNLSAAYGAALFCVLNKRNST